MEIRKRFNNIKSNMLHGGYIGNMLENHIINELTDEILSELGEIEKYNEVKRALRDMFYLGQLSK
jgi:hypothetical protein